jgi:hypothetical protein
MSLQAQGLSKPLLRLLGGLILLIKMTHNLSSCVFIIFRYSAYCLILPAILLFFMHTLLWRD